jgi:hypothetical protein
MLDLGLQVVPDGWSGLSLMRLGSRQSWAAGCIEVWLVTCRLTVTLIANLITTCRDMADNAYEAWSAADVP